MAAIAEDGTHHGSHLHLSSLIAVKTGNASRVILSWDDAANAQPDGFNLLLGKEPIQTQVRRRGAGAVERYMDEVLLSENALPVKLRSTIKRQDLHAACSAPVASLIGPPGTGKTFVSTNLLLHIPAQILAGMPSGKGKKESVPALHCA